MRNSVNRGRTLVRLIDFVQVIYMHALTFQAKWILAKYILIPVLLANWTIIQSLYITARTCILVLIAITNKYYELLRFMSILSKITVLYSDIYIINFHSYQLPFSTSELVIFLVSLRALKYSNIGALFSMSSSNIQTFTRALVTAMYRCFSSAFNTLCWFGSKARGRGRFDIWITSENVNAIELITENTYTVES